MFQHVYIVKNIEFYLSYYKDEIKWILLWDIQRIFNLINIYWTKILQKLLSVFKSIKKYIFYNLV